MANAKLGSDERTTGTHGPSSRANGRRAYWRRAIQCALTLSVLAGWPRWAADHGEGGFTSVGMGTRARGTCAPGKSLQDRRELLWRAGSGLGHCGCRRVLRARE